MDRSAIMAQVKSRDTGPELTVARALDAEGIPYERDVQGLPGRPDFVIPDAAVVLFVHGCFWHGHSCRRGSRVPKKNRAYWVAKVARNRRRDQRVSRALRVRGYSVWILWECVLSHRGISRRVIHTILNRLV